MKTIPLNPLPVPSRLPGDELPALLERAERWLTPVTLGVVALALLSVLVV